MHRPSTTFRDLALALSEDERRSLLKRISASLSLRSSKSERPFKTATTERGRPEMITSEIEALGLWRRIRFFIRRMLSTRGEEQTYVDFRLSELRRRARSVCPALWPIERHNVGTTVAELTWELYRAAYPMIPLFLDFWKGGNYLQEAVEYLLSQRIPVASSDLSDLVTLEELQSTFMANELKGDVRKLVVERLDAYLDGVPDELFRHLEEGLLPFYYLRQICLFDYSGFFDAFGFGPGVAPPEETPPFRPAATSTALPFLEALYYGIHSATRLESGFYFHTELLDSYLEMKEHERDAPLEANPSGASSDEQARQADESAYQSRRIELQRMRDELHELHDAACVLARGIPFSDLIRYYVRDPWLRIRPFLPEVKLKEFHRSYLMIRVLGQLDAQFPLIRRSVVEKMVHELFGGDPPPMTYFRPGVQITPEKSGLPTFSHMKSIAVTYNFLRFLYRGRMQEMVRILSRILPVRQRDSSSDLIRHVAGVEEVLADVEDFDRGFSSDTDDGKSYYRVLYAVEKDPSMQRSYRNLVQQRDRDARSLVDRASEHIQGLSTVFDAIARSLTDQVRERYTSSDSRVNSMDGLDQLIESQRTKLDHFVKLIRQVRAMEEGY